MSQILSGLIRNAGMPARLFCRSLFALALLVSMLGWPVQDASAAQRFNLGIDSPAAALTGGLKDGSLNWADYDNDGDLDLLATGNDLAGSSETSIFTNDNGTLVRHALGLRGVQSSSAAWGDYDNDGYLDVLLTGLAGITSGSKVLFSGVYHNVISDNPPHPAVTRRFVLVKELQPVYRGAGVWGDYDNDGRLDILLTGSTVTDSPFTRIYRNTGSDFESSGIALTPLSNSAAAWGDSDQDGYLDFAITGKTVADAPLTQVYRNNRNGGFLAAVSLSAGVWGGTVNWIDYNNNGFLDLLITGNKGTETSAGILPSTVLYTYQGNNPFYTPTAGAAFVNVWSSSVSVGDYDSDGYPDVALSGLTASGRAHKIYRNNRNGTFSDAAADLPDSSGLSLAWGDFDKDTALDLAVSGVTGSEGTPPVERYFLYVYPNNDPDPLPNAAPTVPNLRAACWDGVSQLTLDWQAATDESTPAAGLTYNLRIGSTRTGGEITDPSSDPASGYHRLPEPGNQWTGTRAYIKYLTLGTYYWGVQALDTSSAGSEFQNNSLISINLNEAVAVPNTYTVQEDALLVDMNVLANDHPGEGGSLSLYSYTQPQHGTLRLKDGSPNVLQYTPTANFSGTDSFTYYALRGSSLYCSQALVNIQVEQVNDQPRYVVLSNDTITEGMPAGTRVGYFITSDIDSGQSYTYALVPDGTNHYNNDRFDLFVSTATNPPTTYLVARQPFIYADGGSYQIHVRSTDSGTPNLSVNQLLTVQVVPSNKPTDILLPDNRILENQDPNAFVGTFSIQPPSGQTDDGNTKFSLVADEQGSSYDNSIFQISINRNLYAKNTVFKYKTRSSYQIYVRAENPRWGTFDKLMTVLIDPTLPTVSGQDDIGNWRQNSLTVSTSEEAVKTLHVRADDQGIGETLTWSLLSGPSNGSVVITKGTTNSGELNDLTYTSNKDWFGTDKFNIQAADIDGNTRALELTVVVANVNDMPTIEIDPEYAVPCAEDNPCIEISGPHEIHLTGITSGPANEGGQKLTVTPVSTDPIKKFGPIIFPKVSSVQPDGTAVITFFVAVGTGQYPIKLVASDGQSQVPVDIKLYVTEREVKYFLYTPLISK